MQTREDAGFEWTGKEAQCRLVARSPLRAAIVLLVAVTSLSGFIPSIDANTIMQRSAEATEADWNAAPEYNHIERDVEDHGDRTYQVLMILGSPYRRLLKVNGSPLTASDQQKEQLKLEETIARRRAESREQREKRVGDYRRERHRDHRMIEELTKAFVFRLSGEATVNSHRVYVLSAMPRPGYRSSDNQTEVLTGMRGSLWIDMATFQWVKVRAEVVHPVSIDGFLAKVEPGTRFELEKAPISDRVWFPSHFSMHAAAKILSFIAHRDDEDETYFSYQKADE
jgi:hypothetical protein